MTNRSLQRPEPWPPWSSDIAVAVGMVFHSQFHRCSGTVGVGALCAGIERFHLLIELNLNLYWIWKQKNLDIKLLGVNCFIFSNSSTFFSEFRLQNFKGLIDFLEHQRTCFRTIAIRMIFLDQSQVSFSNGVLTRCRWHLKDFKTVLQLNGNWPR